VIYAQLTSPFERGTIVREIQTLLRDRYGYSLAVDSVYGPVTKGTVEQFQHSHGIKANGIVDPLTWGKLHTAKARKHKPKPTGGWTPARAAIFVLNHKRGVNYSQNMILRMWGIIHKIRPPKVPKWFDCSAFIIWCFWVAGLRDPSGNNYNGYGYSQNLWEHGNPLQRSEVRENDVCFYGRNGKTEHVTMAVSNTHAVSMGMQGGPYLVLINYRFDYMGARRYGGH
jgi:peptidoglycan hydrolase-like protein with peptidoglycan-binding domain